MRNHDHHIYMIKTVAEALGPELCQRMAFVGGSTTGLLITDTVTQEEVRYTEDVDLIVSVVGNPGWYELCDQLKNHGFRTAMGEGVVCRLTLGELKVDFMPDDPEVLGFTNSWYSEALLSAADFELEEGLVIRLLTPPYFLATKFEAFRGRGNNDLLVSQDIEDIVNLIDGREELAQEVANSDADLKLYIAQQLNSLLEHQDRIYLIQNTFQNDPERAEIVIERIEKMIAMGAS